MWWQWMGRWATSTTSSSTRTTWQIRYLVIDTSNWMGGKWVAVSPSSVTHIEWAKRSVTVGLTREEIKTSPRSKRRTFRRTS